jgi:hypothetical protein
MDDKEEQLEEGIAFAHQGKLKEARAIFEVLAKDPSAAHLHIDVRVCFPFLRLRPSIRPIFS